MAKKTPAELLTLPDGTPAVPTPKPEAAAADPVVASFSTLRKPDKGVNIDSVFYPFAISGTIDADDLEHVIGVGEWIAAGVQYSRGQLPTKPAGMPATIREAEEAIFRAAKIVIPDITDSTLNALGRDQAGLVVASFLAHATGHLSPTQSTGSRPPNRSERRRSRSSK